MDWEYRVISGSLRPRQFEFHPTNDELIFGTLGGYVYNTNLANGSITNLGCYGKGQVDAILGLCWLRNSSNRFIAGSATGVITCGDNRKGFNGYVPGRCHSIVKEYPNFDKLTCVHINSNNDFVLASGYSNDVRIYDIETGAVLQEYKDAHSNHINISRFANLSPFIFTTSSFDRKAKTWDMRMRMREPIYFMECSSGIVMISYSPDDTFILASALDNEISQFLTVDGRRHTTFQVPRTGLEGNFTRAYYSSSGAYVATGACEESSISLLCASTGQLLARQEMYPGRKHSSLYVQSLRGCPSSDNTFCILANYRDLPDRELVLVNIPKPEPLAIAQSFWSENSVLSAVPATAATVNDTAAATAAADATSSRSIDAVNNDALFHISATLEHSADSSPLYLPSPALVQDLSRLRVAARGADALLGDQMATALDVLATSLNGKLRQLQSIPAAQREGTHQTVKELYSKRAVSLVTRAIERSLASGATTTRDGHASVKARVRSEASSAREGDEDSSIALGSSVEEPSCTFSRSGVNVVLLCGGTDNDYGDDAHDFLGPSSQFCRSAAPYVAAAAHRCILFARSPALRGVLTESMRARDEIDIPFPVLDISNIVPPRCSYLLPLLLDYIYTGRRADGGDKLMADLRHYCMELILSSKSSDFDAEMPLTDPPSKLNADWNNIELDSDIFLDEHGVPTSHGSTNVRTPSDAEMLLSGSDKRSRMAREMFCEAQSPWRHSVVGRWLVKTCRDLLVAAMALRLFALVREVEELLASALLPHNAVDVLRVAMAQKRPFLLDHVERYLLNHWDLVAAAHPNSTLVHAFQDAVVEASAAAAEAYLCESVRKDLFAVVDDNGDDSESNAYDVSVFARRLYKSMRDSLIPVVFSRHSSAPERAEGSATLTEDAAFMTVVMQYGAQELENGSDDGGDGGVDSDGEDGHDIVHDAGGAPAVAPLGVTAAGVQVESEDEDDDAGDDDNDEMYSGEVESNGDDYGGVGLAGDDALFDSDDDSEDSDSENGDDLNGGGDDDDDGDDDQQNHHHHEAAIDPADSDLEDEYGISYDRMYSPPPINPTNPFHPNGALPAPGSAAAAMQSGGDSPYPTAPLANASAAAVVVAAAGGGPTAAAGGGGGGVGGGGIDAGGVRSSTSGRRPLDDHTATASSSSSSSSSQSPVVDGLSEMDVKNGASEDVADAAGSVSEKKLAETAKIPRFVGHGCAIIMDNTLVVLGGRNRYRYHGPSSIYALNLESHRWSIFSSSGHRHLTPAALLYHTSVPLQKHGARHVVSIGGKLNVRPGGAAGEEKESASHQVHVLDCLTMTWSSPPVSRERALDGFHPPSPPSSARNNNLAGANIFDQQPIGFETRTRHTVVAVYYEDMVESGSEMARAYDTYIGGSRSADSLTAALGERLAKVANPEKGSTTAATAMEISPASTGHPSATGSLALWQQTDRVSDPTRILHTSGVDHAEAILLSMDSMELRGFRCSAAESSSARSSRATSAQTSPRLAAADDDGDDDNSSAATAESRSANMTKVANAVEQTTHRILRQTVPSQISARDSSNVLMRGRQCTRKVQSMFILFGGFCARERIVKNDLHAVICRVDCPSSSSGGGEETEESSGEHSASTSRGADFSRHSWQWIRPVLSRSGINAGAPEAPAARLGHSAVTLVRPADEGGVRMIIFGGMGFGEIFDDVSSLKCGDVNRMAWERVDVLGPSPGARHGHAMTSLPDQRTMVMMGGVVTYPTFSRVANDVWILTLNRASDRASEGITVTWSRVDMEPAPAPTVPHIPGWSIPRQEGRTAVGDPSMPTRPSPRGRHQCVQKDGRIYFFGGSDEGDMDPDIAREVESIVYMIDTNIDLNEEEHRIATSSSSSASASTDSSFFMRSGAAAGRHGPRAAPMSIGSRPTPTRAIRRPRRWRWEVLECNMISQERTRASTSNIIPQKAEEKPRSLHEDMLALLLGTQSSLKMQPLRAEANKGSERGVSEPTTNDLVKISVSSPQTDASADEMMRDDENNNFPSESPDTVGMHEDGSSLPPPPTTGEITAAGGHISRCPAAASAVPFVVHEAVVSIRSEMLRALLLWEHERKVSGTPLPSSQSSLPSSAVAGASATATSSSSSSDFEQVIKRARGDNSDQPQESVGSEHTISTRKFSAEISVQDCDPHAFAALLCYLYSGTLSVDPEELYSLAAHAHQYGLTHLERICEGLMCRRVRSLCLQYHSAEDNPVVQLLQYADMYGLQSLKSVCFATVLRNWRPRPLLPKTEAVIGTGKSSKARRRRPPGWIEFPEYEYDKECGYMKKQLRMLSPELFGEVEEYRRTHRHAYLMDHMDNGHAVVQAQLQRMMREMNRPSSYGGDDDIGNCDLRFAEWIEQRREKERSGNDAA